MIFSVLSAITAYYNLNIDSIDVKIAFFYEFIDQLVYMQIPKGSKNSANKRIECKLLKVHHDLKFASRLWHKRLSHFLLEKLGFQQINNNHNIFVILVTIDSPIVSTFVNDIKIMESKESDII